MKRRTIIKYSCVFIFLPHYGNMAIFSYWFLHPIFKLEFVKPYQLLSLLVRCLFFPNGLSATYKSESELSLPLAMDKIKAMIILWSGCLWVNLNFVSVFLKSLYLLCLPVHFECELLAGSAEIYKSCLLRFHPQTFLPLTYTHFTSLWVCKCVAHYQT